MKLQRRGPGREANPPPEGAEALAALPSLGPVSARMLQEAGISTPRQLIDLGPEDAWRRLRFVHGRRVTLNFLYALDDAIAGRSWRDTPPERRAELKARARAILSEPGS